MTDVRGARIVRLIQDPELGGDLLLLGLGLAAVYDFGLTYTNGTNGIGDMLWSGSRDPHWTIDRTFQQDVRTYEAPDPRPYLCLSPTPRKSQCGRNATLSGYLTDWATGEKSYCGACTKHRAWADTKLRENWAAKPDLVPLPQANHGGVLAKHFPKIDWPGFWRQLDPRWVEHPEAKPWPKPTLKLVLGDGSGGLTAAPILSVVPLDGVS